MGAKRPIPSGSQRGRPMGSGVEEISRTDPSATDMAQKRPDWHGAKGISTDNAFFVCVDSFSFAR
jgi:hypothetical protein